MEASSRFGTASMIRMLTSIPFASGSFEEVTAVPHIAQPWAAASGAARISAKAASAAMRSTLRKVHQPEERDPHRADEPPVGRRDLECRPRRAQASAGGEDRENAEPDDGPEDVQAVRADEHEEHPAVDPVHDLQA